MTATYDLSSLFQQLEDEQAVPESTAYLGTKLFQTEHHLARDVTGRPLLMVKARLEELRPATIVLENISLEHDVHCLISVVGRESVEGAFSVLHCKSSEGVLSRYFLEFCSTMLRELGKSPTQREVSASVETLIDLFRAIESPPKKHVRGLWGELFLIATAAKPEALLAAWHNEHCDRYDFAMENERLEVKTCSGRRRLHHISWEQANPPVDVTGVVASMFLETSVAGPTLGHLWDRVRAMASTAERRIAIDNMILSTLGSNWREAREVAFDDALAIESLSLFDLREIPRIAELPAGVSEVRYCVDLTDAQLLSEVGRPPIKLLSMLAKSTRSDG